MIVVSDTSPLRVLSFVGLIPILEQEFQRVCVPPLVQHELLLAKPHLPPVDVAQLSFVEVLAPSASRVPAVRGLHAAERQALDLALELGCGAVLIDEAVGRATALRFGLTPVGALRLIVRAKQRGLIAEVAPIINRLRVETRFFIGDDVQKRILMLAGEWRDDA